MHDRKENKQHLEIRILHASTGNADLQRDKANNPYKTMDKDLATRLEALRRSPLAEVKRRLRISHGELENLELTKLQQALVRLPYHLEPSALILFDEVSLCLQAFARQLLLHCIIEQDFLLSEDDPHSGQRVTSRTMVERLRNDHHALQESLCELQSLVAEFHEIAQSPHTSQLVCVLNGLGNKLHEQMLEENCILFPRVSLN